MMRKNSSKNEPLSSERLLERLESKKLIINNREKGLEKIEYFGYTEIVIKYRKPFYDRTKKEYLYGISLEDFYAIHDFDYSLKMIFFTAIGYAEQTIKNNFVKLTRKCFRQYDFNPLDERVVNLFERTNLDKYRKLEEKFNQMYTIQYGNIWHKYGQQSWKLFNVATFNMLVNYYSLLKREYKTELANYFDIQFQEFRTYLLSLENVRNICAHNYLLYNVKLPSLKSNKAIYDFLHIGKDSNTNVREKGVSDLFSVLIVLNSLLDKIHFDELVEDIKGKIDQLKEKCSNASISDIIINGLNFPDGWESIKLWVNHKR